MRRARTPSLALEEEQIYTAQDSPEPHAAMVELLVMAEAQAKMSEGEYKAAVKLQSMFRGYKGRMAVGKMKATTALSDDKRQEMAKAAERKERLAKELAALQRGDTIVPRASSAAATLLLSPSDQQRLLHSPGNSRSAVRLHNRLLLAPSPPSLACNRSALSL